jgi:hypothetical protein
MSEENAWVYKRSEPGLWTVGFYDPSGCWNPESDHESPEEAAKHVRWLNGGRGEEGVDNICHLIATATPADFAAIRRALSAVDPASDALERLARAYHTAAWEGDVIAPSEVVDAWDALLDAGWTGEESEEEEESDG